MSANAIQAGLFVMVVALLVKPVGAYLERVFERRHTCLDPILLPTERLIHRLVGVDCLTRNGLEALLVSVRHIWPGQHRSSLFRASLAGVVSCGSFRKS